MAYTNDGPFSLTAGEALAADRLIKLTSDGVVYCDAGEVPDGLTLNAADDDAQVTIAPLRGGLMRATAAKALTAFSDLYTAADGKVTDTATDDAATIGKNVQACSGANAIITSQLYRPDTAPATEEAASSGGL